MRSPADAERIQRRCLPFRREAVGAGGPVRPAGDSAAGCTAASVEGCEETGDIVTEPDSESCGFCPTPAGC